MTAERRESLRKRVLKCFQKVEKAQANCPYDDPLEPIEHLCREVRDEAIEEAAMLASEVIHSKLLMVNDEALDQIRNLKTSVSKEGSKESRGKA